MELKDALARLTKIDELLNGFKDSSGYVRDEFYHDGSPDEKQQHDIVMQVLQHLEDAQDLLDWLNRPIIHEGPLHKNAGERYEVDGYGELTSGHPLDFWNDEWECWTKSRIEHNGEDYYIYSLGRNKPIEGVKVRLRK